MKLQPFSTEKINLQSNYKSSTLTSRTSAAVPIILNKSAQGLLNNSAYMPVNFKADNNNIFIDKLKRLENVHCPVCGVKMLPKKDLAALLNEGQRIVSARSFINFLERNKEYIPHQNRKFVSSAKRNAAEFDTSNVSKLLVKMRDNAYVFSQNAVDMMKDKIVEAQKKYDFSDSENVLLDECLIRLDEFQVQENENILKPIKKIIQETVGFVRNEHSKDLQSELMKIIIPPAQYQSIFSTDTLIYKNVPYQRIVLQNLFSGSFECVNKIVTDFKEDRVKNVNYILSCKDCQSPSDAQFFRFHQNKENLEENFIKYLEDVGTNILQGRLDGNTDFVLGQIAFVRKISNNNIDVDKFKSPVLREVNIKNFHNKQEKLEFAPVYHSGIPCSTCGNMTITHEERLKLFDEIEKTKTLKELLEFVKAHEQLINNRYKPMLKVFEETLKSNPSVSEEEMIKVLKTYSASMIQIKLKENIKVAKLIKHDMPLEDRQLIEEYINEVNKNFINVSSKKTFPYQEYNDLLKRTVFCVKDEEFLNRYGSKFKENVRKKYSRQNLLFSNDETVKKVGGQMKLVVQNIMKGSVATVDHLVAKNRKGWEAIANYSVMCKSCNSEKTNYSLAHWYDLHPEMKVNMKKYLDKIVELINKGELKDFESYPPLFASCVKKMTNDRIILRFKPIIKDEHK